MINFALLLHAHQPLGNFDHVMEQSYQLSYRPFLELLAEHPKIAITLHYSGSLLEWIEAHHPEYFDLLRTLVSRQQVELLGGGYYEPILISIPDRDKLAQLNKLSDYLETHFGARPKGIWLTERVWEPSLPASLAAAGITYTLTDDTHFLNAGLAPEALYGDYLTESNGSPVRVIPGLKELRYLLPFQAVPEALKFLHKASAEHPEGLAAMGDDLEKFGVWPETHKHVFEEGWLKDFFTQLEAASDEIRSVRAGDYLDAHAPLGRIYLPTASYQEMMEWALPGPAQAAFEEVRHRAEKMENGAELTRFLRGGLWNNFFHKYSEANLLHKRMQWASRALANAAPAKTAPAKAARVKTAARAYATAYDELLAGQCNDAYWHGVFGGLYAPHLRHALYTNLVKSSRYVTGDPLTVTDFDFDGHDEIVLDSKELFVVIDPSDGGTVPEIDYKPGAVNVVNSLMRRPENYHQRLRTQSIGGAGETPSTSIHDRVRSKEEGLEKLLIYDRYERSCFRTHLFDKSKTLADYAALNLAEHANIASGPWAFASSPGALVLSQGGLRKTFAMHSSTLSCALSADQLGACRLGMELIFNFMAPDAHDRYFKASTGDLQVPLRWQGEIAATKEVTLHDEYLGVVIHMRAEPAATWWITPIHTVSQSEDGFEKVYQGSMILPWWDLTGGPFTGRVEIRIGS